MPSKANKRLQHAAKKAAEEEANASALASSAAANDSPCSPSLAVSSVTTANTPRFNEASSSDATLPAAAQLKSLDISDFPSLGSSSPSQHPVSSWGPSLAAGAPSSSSPSSAPSPSVLPTPEDTAPSQEWKCVQEVDMDTYKPSAQLPPIVRSKDLEIEILTTNSYKMSIQERDVWRYDVLIFKRDMAYEKEVPLVGGQRGKKKEGMLDIIQHALKKKNLDGFVAYDGAAILFAVKLWDPKEIEIELNSDKDGLPKAFREKHFSKKGGYFRIILKKNESTSGMLRSTAIYDEKPENLQPRNRNTMNMVQMVLTQEAKNLGFLTTDRGSQLYNLESREDTHAHGPGIVRSIGLSATLKIAEGQKKHGKTRADEIGEVHLVLDSKQTLFFKAGPLGHLQPFQSKPFDIHSARKYLKGLLVGNVYNAQTFEIEDLSEKTTGMIVTDDGTPLLQAAAKRSGKQVSDYNAQLPAIDAKFRDKTTKMWKTFSYVVENLKVVAGQKVSAKQHPPPQSAYPNERWTASRRVARDCRILPAPTTKNRNLDLIGVKIDGEPIDVEGIRLGNPTIHYRNNKRTMPDDRASWKPIELILTKRIEKIIIAYNSRGGIREAVSRVADLKSKLQGYAKPLGLMIPEPVAEDLARTYPALTTDKAILAKLESLKGQNTIFMYADRSDEPSHGVLKLGERLYNVVTQHLAVDKSLQKIQRATLTNILLKLNVKAGGHNHKVSFDSTISKFWGSETKTLVFSYDVCHASGKKSYSRGEFCSEPSCVGFGFNGGENPETIIGDFHYQEPRKEQVNGHILKNKMRIAIMMFAKHRGFPQNIVVIRDGVSDGQYAMVINYEQMAILEGIEEARRLRGGVVVRKPALAIIIATKRHDNRFFKKEPNGKMINARHLTVVDHTIVRQNLNEMIFLSHCPVIGTAQPILLNVLVNNGVFRCKEEIVKLITVLCATHQSSSNLISLPDTVFAADQYAKRGADIFCAFKEHFPNQMPRINGKYDFEAMTNLLCYDKSQAFRSLRIT